MRAALYARLSREDGRATKDNGTERQLRLGRVFAEKQGWTVIEPYVLKDDGHSGADFSRPGLQQVLAGAARKPKPFDVVIVQALDRIGREQISVGNILKLLTRAGIAVWTFTDGQKIQFKTPTEKLMVGVKGMADEQYRASIQEKTATALREKAEQVHVTGPACYGYDREPVGIAPRSVVTESGKTRRVKRTWDHVEYKINEAQARVVRRVFQLAADGLGDNRIRNLLDKETPRPTGWTKNFVRRMLANPLYIGERIYGKVRNVDDDGKGKREPVPESEWIRAPAPALRIIDDQLWEAVQRRKAKTRLHFIRTERGQLAGKPESGVVARFMLSGIARCGECGGTMTHLGGYAKKRYYCLQRAHRGATYCGNRGGVPMDLLDRAVLEKLYDELLSDPGRLWELIEANDRARQLERETAKAPAVNVEKEVTRLEREIGNLVAALAAGTASPDITQAIATRRAQVDALKVPPAPTPLSKGRYVAGYAAFRMLLNSRHPLAVRQVLRRLGCDKIVVTKTGPRSWDFAGEFDAGKIVAAKPSQAPDLIEVDSEGYLIEKGPVESPPGV